MFRKKLLFFLTFFLLFLSIQTGFAQVETEKYLICGARPDDEIIFLRRFNYAIPG